MAPGPRDERHSVPDVRGVAQVRLVQQASVTGGVGPCALRLCLLSPAPVALDNFQRHLTLNHLDLGLNSLAEQSELCVRLHTERPYACVADVGFYHMHARAV